VKERGYEKMRKSEKIMSEMSLIIDDNELIICRSFSLFMKDTLMKERQIMSEMSLVRDDHSLEMSLIREYHEPHKDSCD